MADTQPARNLLDERPIGLAQIVGITLCVLLNALDGFDVLSISFASPGIAEDWGIGRAALGIVLSMELIGMALGSVTIGTLADRWGRKPTILLCLVIMAAGMFGASHAGSVEGLSAWRFATGIGIGGMLAATNAMVAELSNARLRSLAVAVMAAGYPVGAIVGGSIASQLLVSGTWRDVFTLGAGATAAFIPLVVFLLPESPAFLQSRRGPDALGKLNAALRRMKQPQVEALPAPAAEAARSAIAALFGPALAQRTIILTIAYFAQIMTFYFLIKWIPKIVVDMGHDPSTAGGVLVWANVGGLSGALLLSVLSLKIDVQRLVIGAMILSAITVTLFGQGQSTLASLSLMAAIAGACGNAGVVGLYALMALHFPPAVLGGGTGFVIGIGRGGAALGPIVAGFLFSLSFGLPTVSAVMAAGSAVAALAIFILILRGGRADPAR